MPDVLDLPAIEAIGRNVHDAFFRAMLSDPARAEAVIRTHWPRQLHWMLKGESPRPVDSGLVRGDLSQRRTDSLFLVGGQGQRPRALFVPEHKFRVESRTSGQIAEYLDTLREGLRPAASAWLVPVVFFTGEGHWNLPGVIDESSDEEREILRQMQWPGSCFLRHTRAIDYGRLSCEPVSRVMLGMMGLAGQNPYRREELRRMWREDAAGRVVGWALRRQFLSFALATSPLSKEELLELALETGLVSREVKMSVITQPLILDALEKGVNPRECPRECPSCFSVSSRNGSARFRRMSSGRSGPRRNPTSRHGPGHLSMRKALTMSSGTEAATGKSDDCPAPDGVPIRAANCAISLLLVLSVRAPGCTAGLSSAILRYLPDQDLAQLTG